MLDASLCNFFQAISLQSNSESFFCGNLKMDEFRQSLLVLVFLIFYTHLIIIIIIIIIFDGHVVLHSVPHYKKKF